MRKDKRRDTFSPDLTPLIDVVFLLLIFFLVTSTFKKDELALLLNLPKASDGKSSQKEMKDRLVIELTDDKLAVNNSEMGIEEFDQKVGTLEDKTIPVILRADSQVVYQRIVEILGILQKYKIPNLNLITEQKK